MDHEHNRFYSHSTQSPIQTARVQVFKCQHSMAPGYLAELCRPVSSIDRHRHLYDLLAVASLTFHELDCQTLDDIHTLFLSVYRTTHCLCLTLVTSSNISISRPTSTPSTFDVVYS